MRGDDVRQERGKKVIKVRGKGDQERLVAIALVGGSAPAAARRPGAPGGRSVRQHRQALAPVTSLGGVRPMPG